MKKNSIKKLMTAVVIIIALVIFIPRLSFKSVKKYNEEQKQIEEEQLSEKTDGVLGSEESSYMEDTKSEDKADLKKKAEGVNTADSDVKENSDKKDDKTKDSDKKENAKSESNGDSVNKKDDSTKDTSAKDNKGEKSNKKSIKKDKTDNGVKKEEKSDKDNSNNDDKKVKNQNNKKEDDGEYITCNVAIDCISVLDKIDLLNVSVRKHIPSDGIMLKESQIKVKKDASAYDVLINACKANKIVYDAEYSKVYSSTYVKGIGYLYEKMAGDMSGWVYLVNGKTANVGASRYTVNEGDTITWTYTCSGRTGS